MICIEQPSKGGAISKNENLPNPANPESESLYLPMALPSRLIMLFSVLLSSGCTRVGEEFGRAIGIAIVQAILIVFIGIIIILALTIIVGVYLAKKTKNKMWYLLPVAFLIFLGVMGGGQ